MKAINIYILTRSIEHNIKGLYEQSLSNREKEIKVRDEEYALIRTIVNHLISQKAGIEIFECWFYSFTIPQIGKEYDLLRIGKHQIINIELKSQEVAESKIIHQLEQNRMYLGHLGKKIHSFTYVAREDGTSILYKYEDGSLRASDFTELLERLKEMSEPLDDGIEKLFKPGDYLISPINTPDKFLNGQYYLNNNQSGIKQTILAGIRKGEKLFGLSGAAGTGKTLLLYDLANALSFKYKVCIIHSGILSEGHKCLNSKLDNAKIIEAKSLTKDLLLHYEIACVDETQRLSQHGLDILLAASWCGQLKACIFSYDFAQVLSKDEHRRNTPKQLQKIRGFKEFHLKNKIRTNPEILSFVRTALRLYDIPKKFVDYPNVDVVFANDPAECDRILKIYSARGFAFITFTPTPLIAEADAEESSDRYITSHAAIGQEYDNVVQIVDKKFAYNKKGELRGRKHPNQNYLFAKLFYQNVTRARQKLCIIVMHNEKVFRALLMIKEHKYEELRKEFIKE